MKAMSNTLYLVVAAIVILVTAVVVLAIFFNVIPFATGLTEASSICQTQATMSCATYGKMPPTWNIQSMNVKVGETSSTMSCSQILENAKIVCTGCEEKNFRCESKG